MSEEANVLFAGASGFFPLIVALLPTALKQNSANLSANLNC